VIAGISPDNRHALRDEIRKARIALCRVFSAAHALREEQVTPLWDKDVADPAHIINYAIEFIEGCLELDEPEGAEGEGDDEDDADGGAS
jgi:hypothetical protein